MQLAHHGHGCIGVALAFLGLFPVAIGGNEGGGIGLQPCFHLIHRFAGGGGGWCCTRGGIIAWTQLARIADRTGGQAGRGRQMVAAGQVAIDRFRLFDDVGNRARRAVEVFRDLGQCRAAQTRR